MDEPFLLVSQFNRLAWLPFAGGKVPQRVQFFILLFDFLN